MTTNTGPVLVVLAAGRARRYGGCKPLAPVGPAGEAVLDLLVSDAVSAGFNQIILVLGPSTGPAIRYHVERCWPSWVNVSFAVQEVPLGTVSAVLSASPQLDPSRSFGVCNADDLYGEMAFSLLADHIASAAPANALVAFDLANGIIGEGSVTRGVCELRADGSLASIVERRGVHATGDDRFVVDDGLEPKELAGDTPVSMNLWAFNPHLHSVLAAAMARAEHASVEAEVLLPEVIGQQLGAANETGSTERGFRVLRSHERCLGVTHPEDLGLVQAELARQIGAGNRPGQLWSAKR